MRTVLVVIFLFFFLVLSLPFLGLCALLRDKNPEKIDRMQLSVVQWAFRVISFLSGIRLTVIGEENVPADRPVLFIGNHRSFFDVVITYARMPGLCGYISKMSIKKVPILSLYMERLHCLFLDRTDIRQGLKIILEAIDHVKNGISICVFPEGTRNKNPDPAELLPFHEGTFKIATKTGCSIVPFVLIGSDNILENHFPEIRRTKVTLVYGKPIDPASLSKEESKHIGSYCREIMQGMIRDNMQK